MKIERTMENMSNILGSLVVKMDFVADYMNLQISTHTDILIDYDDKATWLYYMNMSGLKHEVNNDVHMKSLDTGEIFIITKDSLKTHPLTHMELKKYGTVFDYVCKDNGSQSMYIRGMINPIPMERILDAPDLSILWYDKNLISDREDHLIKDLEIAIQKHMFQWFNPSLTFEDRYVPTLIAQLFSVMSLAIINSKLKVVNTEKASNEHIYEFLNSSNHSADIIPFLSEENKLWLYGNIRRLMRNVGKDSTLQEIVERILIPAGIDVYKLNYEEARFEETDNSNPFIVPWNMDVILMLNSMNPEDSKMDIKRISEKTYLKMQADYTELEESIRVKEIANNRIISPKNNMQSKSIVLDIELSSVNIGFDVSTMIIENWLIDSFNNKLQTVLPIVPTNDDELILNSRDAAYLFLYLLLKEADLPTTIRGFNTTTYIHRRDFSNFYQIKDSDNHNIFSKIINEVPTEIETNRIDEYREHIRKLKMFHTMLWSLPSTYGEKIVSTNVKLLSKFMFHNVVGDSYIPLTYSGELQNIHLYLEDLSIPTRFNNPVEIMNLLLEGFTGESFDKNGSIKSKIEIFKNFLKKFISYNIQILDLPKAEAEPSVLETVSLIRGMDAILIEDLDISPLGDPIDGELIGVENKQPVRLLIDRSTITEISRDKETNIYPLNYMDKVSIGTSGLATVAVIKPEFFTRLHSVIPINSVVTRVQGGITTVQEYMRNILVYMREINPDRIVVRENDHVVSYIDSPNKEHIFNIRVSGVSNPIIIGAEEEAVSLKDVVARVSGTNVAIVELSEGHKLFIHAINDRVKITSVDASMGLAKKPKMQTYSLNISDVEYIDNIFRNYMTGITMKDIVEDNILTFNNDVELVSSHIGPSITIIG